MELKRKQRRSGEVGMVRAEGGWHVVSSESAYQAAANSLVGSSSLEAGAGVTRAKNQEVPEWRYNAKSSRSCSSTLQRRSIRIRSL